jgi:hypothetical protein
VNGCRPSGQPFFHFVSLTSLKLTKDVVKFLLRQSILSVVQDNTYVCHVIFLYIFDLNKACYFSQWVIHVVISIGPKFFSPCVNENCFLYHLPYLIMKACTPYLSSKIMRFGNFRNKWLEGIFDLSWSNRGKLCEGVAGEIWLSLHSRCETVSVFDQINVVRMFCVIICVSHDVLWSLLYCVHYTSIGCTVQLLSVLCIYSLYYVSIVFTWRWTTFYLGARQLARSQ